MTFALAGYRTALTPPWVRDPLWRLAQAVPSLDLRFADSKSLVDAVTGASLVTFTRASSGTFVDSAGVLQTAATDVPRFNHNPTTGESLGLLMEEARTNLLVGSAAPATQIVTVTAVAHTLHFTGTGTITLTDASTAGPLVGTGTGEANRVSLTFTPTAGSLTLTVSGTVTNAQLEAGAFRSSYINSPTAAATRAADVASITGSAFSSWYRQSEGTIFTDCSIIYTVPGTLFPLATAFNDNTSNNRIENGFLTSTNAGYDVVASGSAQVGMYPNAGSALNRKLATTYQLNNFAASVNGGSVSTDTSGTVPTVSQLRIGDRTGGGPNALNGTIRRLTFFPQRLPNSTLQSITQ